MNRRVKSPNVALARMMNDRQRIGWDPGPRRSTIRRLAFMADQARRQKMLDVPAEIRWCGMVPSRGVKGWEREALEWLKLK